MLFLFVVATDFIGQKDLPQISKLEWLIECAHAFPTKFVLEIHS
jgi:hypothetical protein